VTTTLPWRGIRIAYAKLRLLTVSAIGMMGVVKSAFVAIYRWRVHPEKDVQFRHAWHRLTWSIREFRGSHGSRLLCDETGSYVAIALWPSRESWEATTPPLPDEDELMGLLRESITESFPPQLLTVADDLWCVSDQRLSNGRGDAS